MGPRLSIVLVAHREQGFLEPCLQSVLDGTGDEIEVVAIDDASPDHVPELLDAAATRDARVRVEHRAQRVGLGAGRQAGLELAQGEYVWFIRVTDTADPAPVLAALREDPDVLLLQHQRAAVTGGRRPGLRQSAISDASPELFDKVFRRQLISGLRFGNAGHSGLTVSWPALLAAQRIAVLDEPAYVRLDPPNATRDALTTGSPSDALDQYERIDARSDALAGAIVRHATALLPAKGQRGFVKRAAALARRAGSPQAQGRRERLVAGGRGTQLSLLATAGRARRRVRGLPGGVRRRLRRTPYRKSLRQPIDPKLAAYAAYWYRGYACNPRAIYEKARELAPDVRGVWIVKAEGAKDMPPGVEHVVSGTPEYYDLLARARYLINNVNFPNHVVKRAGQVHVMTHHGTPLKRMGMDLANAPGKDRNLTAMLRRSRRWDYSVTANAFTTLIWERVFPVRCETLETGYPRNDALANATPEDARRIREQLGIAEGQTAVLYAPTHREYADDPTPPLDLADVASALGPEFVVMARLHYFYDEHPVLRALHEEGRIRDVASHPSVEELCIAADVLVTDYSSIMFDYAVLDRPIVIHAPDWETYREQRGTYFDLMSEAPGPITRSEQELVEVLRTGRDDAAARAAFRERFCSLEDGGAAERVVRRVFS
jgi:CDP-glycerol glycerophosphotransferase